MKKKMLKVEDMYVAYNKKEVVRGVNFTLADKEKVLLVGPNGAGKSTFLKSIAGILKAKKGKIFYNGDDITYLSLFERVKIGIVYLKQERDIFPSLTVKENLEIAGYGLSKGEFQSNLEELISFFPNVKDKLNQRAGLLSGGERRSLGILMVLLKRPRLLLLDEPTAGLAPGAAAQILEKLQEIQSSMRMATIMVEHNLYLVSDKVDRVSIMKEGQIVFSEALGDLSSNLENIAKFYF